MTWSSHSLDASGNWQNFAVFSLWKNLKTFEIRATWPPSLAGPGMCLLPAQNHLLGAPNLTLPQFIFLLGEMFSIINCVVPVFPEPFPWKEDPELVVRPGLTVGRSSRFPWQKGEKVFPRTFQSQRNQTGTSALIEKEKDQGRSGDIALQARETVPNHVIDFLQQ